MSSTANASMMETLDRDTRTITAPTRKSWNIAGLVAVRPLPGDLGVSVASLLLRVMDRHGRQNKSWCLGYKPGVSKQRARETVRALHGYGIRTDAGDVFEPLRECAGTLLPPQQASVAVQDFVADLNVRKTGWFWGAEPWEDFLQSLVASDACVSDALTLYVPEHANGRRRVGEFARRMAILETLLTGDLHREDLLVHLLAAATLHPMDEVRAHLAAGGAPADAEWESFSVTGLSGSSLSTDVEYFRSVGFGFEPAPERLARQAYHLDTARLPLWVNPDEAWVITNVLPLIRDMGLPETRLLERLIARIPPQVRALTPQMDPDPAVRSARDKIDPAIVAELRQAIARRAPIKILYRGVEAAAPSWYYLEHARLMWLEGHLYIVAHCPRTDGPTAFDKNREFRLDRFPTDVKQVVEVCKGPATVSMMPTFKVSFRCDRAFAARFEGRGDGVRVLDDGSPDRAIVEMEEINPLRAVRRLLSYADRAIPVSPPFIVERYQQKLTNMAMQLNT